MKIVGICGSPRRGGNTEILLKEALRGASEGGAEVEEVFLRDKTIRGSPRASRDVFRLVVPLLELLDAFPLCVSAFSDDQDNRVWASLESCHCRVSVSRVSMRWGGW